MLSQVFRCMRLQTHWVRGRWPIARRRGASSTQEGGVAGTG
jgi:hypothetical protein